jgi:hypothetical protein
MRQHCFGDCFVIAGLQAIGSGDSIPSGRSSPTLHASNFAWWWRPMADNMPTQHTTSGAPHVWQQKAGGSSGSGTTKF